MERRGLGQEDNFQDALLGRCQELRSSLYTSNLSSLTVRTILILTRLGSENTLNGYYNQVYRYEDNKMIMETCSYHSP